MMTQLPQLEEEYAITRPLAIPLSIRKEDEQKIRAAGIEPATLRLLRSSHYSLTLYQLS